MSLDNEIELISEPKTGRDGSISVKVRFNYVDGSPIELFVTVSGGSEIAFWQDLERMHFNNRPNTRVDPQILVEKLKKTKKRKVR